MVSASERVQELMRTFEDQAAKASQLQSAMQDLQGTASSQDRSVAVTVAASGAVLDLQLAPSAVRKSAYDLQQQITATIREATANAAERMNEAVAPILGDEFDRFQEAFNARVPAVAPPEATASPPADRPASEHEPRGDDDDGDFSARSFLR